MSLELDALDRLAASVYDGYLVRKYLVRKYSRQYPVPTYVVEFLMGRYCASVDENEINEGLQIVEKQLKDRTVRTGEEELFKARSKETGSVKLIDIVRARLDAKNDCFVAELPSLRLTDVRIDEGLVRTHERMLTGGFYAEVDLRYDPVVQDGDSGFRQKSFPFQYPGIADLVYHRVNKDGFLARREEHEIVVAMNPATFSQDLKDVQSGGAFFYADDIKLPVLRQDVAAYAMPVKAIVRASEAPSNLRDYIANMVYVGVLIKMLQIDLESIKQALNFHFRGKQKPIDMNLSVIKAAYEWADQNLEKKDPYLVEAMEQASTARPTLPTTADPSI